jgi:hypothetical protein
MGVSRAYFDGNGNFDLVKTNFAGDTTSLSGLGGGMFEDQTFQAGLGKVSRFLGWGIAFVDYDNDGWADIVQFNGHVYPEVGETLTESGYRQRSVCTGICGTASFRKCRSRWRRGSWTR